MSVTIHTPKRAKDPLYCHYQGQFKAQPAFLEFDPDSGVAHWDWSGNIGPGSPERVWNGRVIRWDVSPKIKWTAIWKISKDPRFAEALETLRDTERGSDERWEACSEVSRIIEEYSPRYNI